MVYVIQVCRKLSSSSRIRMELLDSCLQNCMTYITAVGTVKTPVDGQSNCPKYVEIPSKMNLGN
jgi:hypothetical protein